MMEPVAYRGRITKNGYLPENHEWRDQLCDRDRDGRLVGKDPMALSLDVLSASGHPQASARSVLARLKVMHGVERGHEEDFPFGAPSRLTEIRDTICKPCSADNLAEVRRCSIYDCPAWQFRMGRNPHNPQRGINPFAK
jgi:hypothetical protein